MERSDVRTLRDLILCSAKEYGDKTFLKERAGKEVLSHSHNDLKNDALRLVSFLRGKGLHRVHAAVTGPTCYCYLVSYFGTVMSDNVIVPLDAQLGAEDLTDHLQRSDAEVFFYDKRHAAMLPDIQANCPKIHTCIAWDETAEGLTLAQILAENPVSGEEIAIDPASCAAILYTSGTTGKSKGVMLRHSNLIDNTMCQDNESTPEDSLLTVLPIHHVYCFTCDILLSLRYGTTVCVNDSMLHIAQNLAFFKPTTLLLVPMIAETIYKKIRAAAQAKPEIPIAAIAQNVFGGNLKVIYSGGAYLNPELAEIYRSFGFIMAQGYGMTECSPRISTASREIVTQADVGQVVNGCTVKIVDGEITVKSPSVMMGYYKNPEATAEALTEDGWLRTGDLGYVNEQNRLFITGRKKNLIILANGENVSPEELENKFAGVDFAAEVLVYAEDDLICAEILPAPDFVAAGGDAAAALIEFTDKCNKTLPPAKAIHRLRIRDTEFDKTPSKKIKRQQTTQGKLIR